MDEGSDALVKVVLYFQLLAALVIALYALYSLYSYAQRLGLLLATLI